MRLLPVKMQAVALILLLGAPGLTGCGDDETPRREFPANPGPVTISAEQRGLPMELNRSYPANRVQYETHLDDVGAIFIFEQVHSEYVDATDGPSDAANLDERVDAIYESSGFGDELATYDTVYLVVDLQRRDREWLVDWDGLSRDEEGNRDSLTFERTDDYRADVLARVEAAVQRGAPSAVIVGTEMNRYYEQNPSDWGNFTGFYWELFDAIKAVDGSIRVGPGFNWSYLMETNARAFAPEGFSNLTPEAFEPAYEAIVQPLLSSSGRSSDFVGLAAIPDPNLYDGEPSNVPDEHFAGLRLVLASGTLPIVWHQVGWPIRSASAAQPAQWYARFQELVGGTSLERVCWYGLTNLLAADCTPLTGSAVGAPETVCFQGLFANTGAATAGGWAPGGGDHSYFE